MVVKAGFPPDKTVEVYDSWYGLTQNPYKKDTDIVERESQNADLVLGQFSSQSKQKEDKLQVSSLSAV